MKFLSFFFALLLSNVSLATSSSEKTCHITDKQHVHLDVTSKLGEDYGENSARVLGWDVRYDLITRGTVKTASCPGYALVLFQSVGESGCIDGEVLTFLGERTETDGCMDHVGLSFEFHGYAAIGPEQVLLLARFGGNNPQSLASSFKEDLEVAQFRAREGLGEEKPKAKQILIDNNSFLESLQIKPPSPQSPKLARIRGYTRHSIIDKKKLTYSNELFSPFVSKTIPEGYKAFFLRDEKTLKTFYEKLQETLGKTKFIKGEEPPTLPSFKLYSESNPVLLLKEEKEAEWHYFFRIFHEFPR